MLKVTNFIGLLKIFKTKLNWIAYGNAAFHFSKFFDWLLMVTCLGTTISGAAKRKHHLALISWHNLTPRGFLSCINKYIFEKKNWVKSFVFLTNIGILVSLKWLSALQNFQKYKLLQIAVYFKIVGIVYALFRDKTILLHL